MSQPVDLVEIWRGEMVESIHPGHAVVTDSLGQVAHAWGDASAVIYPRSSCKMVQALPLIESGAAAAYGLTPAHLALACASHQGAAIHTDRVRPWLDHLGLGDDDLRCGPQRPGDRAARHALIRADASPCQIHNNCSGKHAGFLTLNQHMGASADYELADHPLQVMIKTTFEEVTGEDSPRYAIDGCSAPSHATTVHGLARAMSLFATAHDRHDTRARAALALRDAMMAHPDLVAGEGRACTNLMRACGGRAAVKTGAEGVFVAIIPETGQGVALKIIDGATRASECAMAAILVKLGVMDPAHPSAAPYFQPQIANWRNTVTGHMTPAAALL